MEMLEVPLMSLQYITPSSKLLTPTSSSSSSSSSSQSRYSSQLTPPATSSLTFAPVYKSEMNLQKPPVRRRKRSGLE